MIEVVQDHDRRYDRGAFPGDVTNLERRLGAVVIRWESTIRGRRDPGDAMAELVDVIAELLLVGPCRLWYATKNGRVIADLSAPMVARDSLVCESLPCHCVR